MAQTVRKLTIGAVAASVVLTLLSAPLTASASDYPRRIAVAPFVNLTGQDEIKPVVAVLPRLLSTRLMALSGAETVLLPPGEKPPGDAAKEAGLPLLLQGTVSKLGKGYSIDTTVTDLSTGKPAGAFFAGASTEDDIIPQLGLMAGEIAEKVFGIRQPAPVAAAQPQAVQPVPVASPAPAGQPVAVLPAPAPPGPQAAVPAPLPGSRPAGPVPVAPVAPAALPASAPASAAAAPPTTSQSLKEGWVPTAITKIAQSDPIPDELLGVTTGDAVDADTTEAVAFGRTTLYVYRVKQNTLAPYVRIPRPVSHHFLNVEMFDVDGDGKKDIVVTDLVNDSLQSFILKRKGDAFEHLVDNLPYFLVVLPDWNGSRVLVGQRKGFDTPFAGKFYKMVWDGKALKEGEPLPADTGTLPLSGGILGLSSAAFGPEWRFIYTDELERLRVVDQKGKSLFKSKEKFGTSGDFFEWGEMSRLEGKRPRYLLRDPARVLSGPEGMPFILIPVAFKGLVGSVLGSLESSRLALLQWDGGEFAERAATPKSNNYISGADAISPRDFRRGSRVVASVIEQESSAWKKPVSRLLLEAVE